MGFKGLVISKTTELTHKKCIRYSLWGSTVGIATVLLAGRPGVKTFCRNTKPSLLQAVQTHSGAHPASYSMGTVVLSRW